MPSVETESEGPAAGLCRCPPPALAADPRQNRRTAEIARKSPARRLGPAHRSFQSHGADDAGGGKPIDTPLATNQVEFHPLLNQDTLLAAAARPESPSPPTARSPAARFSATRFSQKLPRLMEVTSADRASLDPAEGRFHQHHVDQASQRAGQLRNYGFHPVQRRHGAYRGDDRHELSLRRQSRRYVGARLGLKRMNVAGIFSLLVNRMPTGGADRPKKPDILPVTAYQVARPFTDHDRGGIGVGADEARHDREIADADAVETRGPGVADRPPPFVRAHLACAGRVIGRPSEPTGILRNRPGSGPRCRENVPA